MHSYECFCIDCETQHARHDWLDKSEHPGVVRYIGRIAKRKGLYVGLELLDFSEGLVTGEFDGVRYFRYAVVHACCGSEILLASGEGWRPDRHDCACFSRSSTSHYLTCCGVCVAATRAATQCLSGQNRCFCSTMLA